MNTRITQHVHYAGQVRHDILLTITAMLVSLGAAELTASAQSTPRFTDWTSVSSTRVVGTLGGAAVTLTSSRESPFGGTVVDGSSTAFNDPLFAPPLASSDVVYFRAAPTPVTYTFSFTHPVVNPVLHLQSLASVLDFAGASPVKLSGQDVLQVAGTQVVGLFPGPLPLPYNDANGSVLLPGAFSSITFTATWQGGVDGIGLQLGETASIPLIWSGSYDPALATLPQAQGWTLMQSGPASPSPQVSGGVLTIGPTSPGSTQVFGRNDIATRFVSGTSIIEMDLQVLNSDVTSNGTTWYTGYWFYIVDTDGRQALLGFTNSGVYVGNNNEPAASTFTNWDTTSGFSRYRLFINSGGISLWANETLLVNNYPLGSTSNTRTPGRWFGAHTGLPCHTRLSGFRWGTSAVTFAAAGPGDNAFAIDTRADPGTSAPATSLNFNSLTIVDGGNFTLGSNEILNLNGGLGSLIIQPGGIFSGIGIVNGNILNQGLLRIPPTRITTANVTSGGNIVIPVPPSYGEPVVIPSPTPVETHQDTMLSFTGSGGGGWGGGGDGGTAGGSSGSFSSGGGHYVIQSPAVTFQGTTAWDGELEVTGTFEQTDTSFLRLFIAGSEQGETYSLLSVGQSATIDGTIQIVLDPVLLGYTPNVGDSFDMLIADAGITTAPDLAVQTLVTVDGAASLGLELDPYLSPFLMDPDDLVVFPTSLFDMALVNEGTTLRFTLNQPICSPQPIASTAPACGRDVALFTIPNPGSGPLTYQWQIEDAPMSETWHNIDAGFYPELGTVLTPTGRTMSIRKPRYFAGGTRFRCIITNPCNAITTAPTTLVVLDQTEETCGGCAICEADFDDNGGVDGADLSGFFSAYEGGAICADVDRNGGIDGADLALFFILYESGGCE